ncbi:predicted protein, partial [Nematostella vectensis]
VGGNWKLNGSRASIQELLEAWGKADLDKSVEVVISPPAVYADFLRANMPAEFGLALQNVYKEGSGAFTGE